MTSPTSGDETAREEDTAVHGGGAGAPGLLVVWSGGAPAARAIRLVGGAAVVGRGDVDDDALVSRAHVEIRRDGGAWTVRDLGSRNGTHVDGRALDAPYRGPAPRVIRIGGALLVPRDDLGAGLRVTSDDGVIAGPALRDRLAIADDAARRGDNLLIEGETGTGKELIARRFHAARGGSLIEVNCAAIPSGMAERLILGSRRGAYSGAVDAIGYVEAADGGVLFLDEIGELELAVQAKLLRVLETRVVVALGATAGKRVQVAACFATHRDLSTAVADGSFRADLYYRIAQPRLTIPPLRDRVEEIPYLIARELAAASIAAQPKLIEACLLRAWPGNVRELQAAIREAISRARRAGDAHVRAAHLTGAAGAELTTPVPMPLSPPEPPDDGVTPSRRDVVAALEQHAYNVSAAATALGLHRTQLYRRLKQLGIELARTVRDA